MGFDQDLVAIFARAARRGYQADAGLVIFHLFGNTDHHDFYVPTWRGIIRPLV